jgi:hypothetical protein
LIQKKELKLKEDEVEKRLTKIFESKYIEFENKLTKEFDKKIKKVDGSVYHVQGLMLLNSNEPFNAFISFIYAMMIFMSTEDNYRLRKIIDLLILSFNEVENKSLLSTYKSKLLDNIKCLNHFDKQYLYENDIKTLNNILKQIPDEVFL